MTTAATAAAVMVWLLSRERFTIAEVLACVAINLVVWLLAPLPAGKRRP